MIKLPNEHNKYKYNPPPMNQTNIYFAYFPILSPKCSPTVFKHRLTNLISYIILALTELQFLDKWKAIKHLVFRQSNLYFFFNIFLSRTVNSMNYGTRILKRVFFPLKTFNI